jgi:taurine--2-oxoglutarate transaminase
MVELASAAKAKGLWPFTHFNRVHVVPPVTIPDDEATQGIAILDEVLTLADAHYTG